MKRYYKILHEDLKHYGMQYHLGLNEDIRSFDPDAECGGGLFFSDKKQVLNYFKYSFGTKLAIIEIPKDEQIIKVGSQYKAHRIIIKEIKDLWTIENYRLLKRRFTDTEIFLYCCENNSLDFAQFLYNLETVNTKTLMYSDITRILMHRDMNIVFSTACCKGYSEIANWLYSLGVIDIHFNEEYAFRLACEHGHLETAKWLYDLGNIDIHSDNEYAFRLACEHGHSAVIEWLYELDDINIHIEHEYAFRVACILGYLEIAKWLYTLGNVNIHIEDDIVFRHSPYCVLKWLNTL